jgi:D-arabinono-1,4-lactone oxidase
VVRIDFYWFVGNAGNPAQVFYPQFWKLFRDNGVPFRLHWGKFQPMGDEAALASWAAFFRSQYARWDDFLSRRQKLDPNNVFLTTYWRQRFGLLDLPLPQRREDGAKNVFRIDTVPAPRPAAPVKESPADSRKAPVTQPSPSPWREVSKLVGFYSWLTLAVVLYGVAVAHIPFLIGTPWTTCEGQGSPLGCVLAFHLFEVPLVSFNAFMAWYGLRRFTSATASRYRSLLLFAVSVNLVFFAFETVLLLGGLQRLQPLWETLALFSVALALGGGAFLGMYVHQKLQGVLREERGEALQPTSPALPGR